MVHGIPDYVPALGDDVAWRVYETFFATLRLLVAAGVTVVAEAAFQDRLWRRGVEPLLPLAEVKVVQCQVGADVAARRVSGRRRSAHADGQWVVGEFERVALGVPEIRVDTTDGYVPGIAAIVGFVNGGDATSGGRR